MLRQESTALGHRSGPNPLVPSTLFASQEELELGVQAVCWALLCPLQVNSTQDHAQDALVCVQHSSEKAKKSSACLGRSFIVVKLPRDAKVASLEQVGSKNLQPLVVVFRAFQQRLSKEIKHEKSTT